VIYENVSNFLPERSHAFLKKKRQRTWSLLLPVCTHQIKKKNPWKFIPFHIQWGLSHYVKPESGWFQVQNHAYDQTKVENRLRTNKHLE
jgi:hypothetical protein